MKTPTENAEMNKYGCVPCVPIKLYYKNRQRARFVVLRTHAQS
jgi:hypothetical protein